MILGAHQGASGGLYKAVLAAVETGCDCVQFFSKNNSRWKSKPLAEKDIEEYRQAYEESPLQAAVIHDSYLINLAAPADELWEKSIAAMFDELFRAHQLGVPHVVIHPGAYTSSSEQEGLARIAAAIDKIHENCDDGEIDSQILLETTAGQGTTLGRTFEQLATIIEGTAAPEKLGICLDTCHLFAAGYELQTEEGFTSFAEQLDALLGFDRVKAIHLNDSKTPFGSRKDRHEHIGQGEMGLEPFRQMLSHPALSQVPMYLETKKAIAEDGRTMDEINLEVLRGLV